MCNGYVTAVSVALSGGAHTVSINKIWKNPVAFLLLTVSLSPRSTVTCLTMPSFRPVAKDQASDEERNERHHDGHERLASPTNDRVTCTEDELKEAN